MAAPLDPIAARELVEDLGFLLVPGRPFASGNAYLIVAVRRRPTRHHFDPERVDYWLTCDGRGVPSSADISTRQVTQRFAWGAIRVVDRLAVENVFASFGGSLATAAFDSMRIFLFSSSAPIVARGGHSQGWDPESHEIDAFIGRLRAAAVPGGELERQLAVASPDALYAAFICSRLRVVHAAEARVGWRRADRVTLETERRRLREQAPADWQAGVELADRLRHVHQAGR